MHTILRTGSVIASGLDEQRYVLGDWRSILGRVASFATGGRTVRFPGPRRRPRRSGRRRVPGSLPRGSPRRPARWGRCRAGPRPRRALSGQPRPRRNPPIRPRRTRSAGRSRGRRGRRGSRAISACLILLRPFALVDRERESAQSNGVSGLRERDWDNGDAYPTLIISAGGTRVREGGRGQRGAAKFRSFLVGSRDESRRILDR